MSFKNDYKSAFGSVSPDTDKIIAGVHERLNENTPTKLRVQQYKTPVWKIVGSVAGAAACVALFATVMFRVVPNVADEDTNGMMGPNMSYQDYHNSMASAENQDEANNGGIDNNFDGSFYETAPSASGVSPSYNGEDNSGQPSIDFPEFNEDIVLEVSAENILNAEEVFINGSRYVKAEIFTISFIPEEILPVKNTDGRLFYVYSEDEDGVIVVADEHWKQNNRVWGFIAVDSGR